MLRTYFDEENAFLDKYFLMHQAKVFGTFNLLFLLLLELFDNAVTNSISSSNVVLNFLYAFILIIETAQWELCRKPLAGTTTTLESRAKVYIIPRLVNICTGLGPLIYAINIASCYNLDEMDSISSWGVVISIRTTRMFRLIPLIRFIWLFQEMHKISTNILGTFKFIRWVFAILIFSCLFFGEILSMGLGFALGRSENSAVFAWLGDDATNDALVTNNQNLYNRYQPGLESFRSTFGLILGDDWLGVSEDFQDVNPWLMIYVYGFTLVISLGLLQVVTAAFCGEFDRISDEDAAKKLYENKEEFEDLWTNALISYVANRRNSFWKICLKALRSKIHLWPHPKQKLSETEAPLLCVNLFEKFISEIADKTGVRFNDKEQESLFFDEDDNLQSVFLRNYAELQVLKISTNADVKEQAIEAYKRAVKNTEQQTLAMKLLSKEDQTNGNKFTSIDPYFAKYDIFKDNDSDEGEEDVLMDDEDDEFARYDESREYASYLEKYSKNYYISFYGNFFMATLQWAKDTFIDFYRILSFTKIDLRPPYRLRHLYTHCYLLDNAQTHILPKYRPEAWSIDIKALNVLSIVNVRKLLDDPALVPVMNMLQMYPKYVAEEICAIGGSDFLPAGFVKSVLKRKTYDLEPKEIVEFTIIESTELRNFRMGIAPLPPYRLARYDQMSAFNGIQFMNGYLLNGFFPKTPRFRQLMPIFRFAVTTENEFISLPWFFRTAFKKHGETIKKMLVTLEQGYLERVFQFSQGKWWQGSQIDQFGVWAPWEYYHTAKVAVESLILECEQRLFTYVRSHDHKFEREFAFFYEDPHNTNNDTNIHHSGFNLDIHHHIMNPMAQIGKHEKGGDSEISRFLRCVQLSRDFLAMWSAWKNNTYAKRLPRTYSTSIDLRSIKYLNMKAEAEAEGHVPVSDFFKNINIDPFIDGSILINSSNRPIFYSDEELKKVSVLNILYDYDPAFTSNLTKFTATNASKLIVNNEHHNTYSNDNDNTNTKQLSFRNLHSQFIHEHIISEIGINHDDKQINNEHGDCQKNNEHYRSVNFNVHHRLSGTAVSPPTILPDNGFTPGISGRKSNFGSVTDLQLARFVKLTKENLTKTQLESLMDARYEDEVSADHLRSELLRPWIGIYPVHLVKLSMGVRQWADAACRVVYGANPQCDTKANSFHFKSATEMLKMSQLPPISKQDVDALIKLIKFNFHPDEYGSFELGSFAPLDVPLPEHPLFASIVALTEDNAKLISPEPSPFPLISPHFTKQSKLAVKPFKSQTNLAFAERAGTISQMIMNSSTLHERESKMFIKTTREVFSELEVHCLKNCTFRRFMQKIDCWFESASKVNELIHNEKVTLAMNDFWTQTEILIKVIANIHHHIRAEILRNNDKILFGSVHMLTSLCITLAWLGNLNELKCAEDAYVLENFEFPLEAGEFPFLVPFGIPHSTESPSVCAPYLHLHHCKKDAVTNHSKTLYHVQKNADILRKLKKDLNIAADVITESAVAKPQFALYKLLVEYPHKNVAVPHKIPEWWRGRITPSRLNDPYQMTRTLKGDATQGDDSFPHAIELARLRMRPFVLNALQDLENVLAMQMRIYMLLTDNILARGVHPALAIDAKYCESYENMLASQWKTKWDVIKVDYDIEASPTHAFLKVPTHPNNISTDRNEMLPTTADTFYPIDLLNIMQANELNSKISSKVNKKIRNSIDNIEFRSSLSSSSAVSVESGTNGIPKSDEFKDFDSNSNAHIRYCHQSIQNKLTSKSSLNDLRHLEPNSVRQQSSSIDLNEIPDDLLTAIRKENNIGSLSNSDYNFAL